MVVFANNQQVRVAWGYTLYKSKARNLNKEYHNKACDRWNLKIIGESMVKMAISKGYLKKFPWLGKAVHFVNLDTQGTEAACELKGSLVFA